MYDWIWMVFCVPVWWLFASLPFCLLVCYVWSLPLQWSPTSLMWADVRTLGSGDGNRDAAAWGIGQVLGPPWGPLPADSVIYVFVYEQDLPFLFVLSFSLVLVGPCGALFLKTGDIWSIVYILTLNPVLSDYSCMWCFINWGYLVFGTLQQLHQNILFTII